MLFNFYNEFTNINQQRIIMTFKPAKHTTVSCDFIFFVNIKINLKKTTYTDHMSWEKNGHLMMFKASNQSKYQSKNA